MIETKKAGDDSLFKPADPAMARPAQRYGLDHHPDDTEQRAERRAGGIDDSDGPDAIANSIHGVTRLSPYRSQVAARTETNAAANFAAVESARNAETDLGIKLLKTWLPTLDNRTRPDNADMASYGAIP